MKLKIVQEDPWLEDYKEEIYQRWVRFQLAYKELANDEKGLIEFASGHEYFGINFDINRQAWIYREWAPEAEALFLIGDFNNWDRSSHPLQMDQWGVWEIVLPYSEYKDRLVHKSLVKVHVVAANGNMDRIPAYIRRVVQDEESKDFSGQIWAPEKPFIWTDKAFEPDFPKDGLPCLC